MRILALLILALALAGCGAGTDLPTAGTPTTTTALRSRAEGLTLNLKAGWNAVGFQCVEVTAVAPNPAVAGMVWWDGRSYQTAAVTADEVNRAGLGHGFFLYATEATALSYAGQRWLGGERLGMRLEAGWNLVAFPTEAHNVRCYDGQDDVAADSVVLDTLQPADRARGPVDLEGAMPGIPYWLYSSRATVLAYSPVASPSPSASPVEPSPAAVPSPSAQPSPSPAVTGGGGGVVSGAQPPSVLTQPVTVTAGAPFDLEVQVQTPWEAHPVTVSLADAPAGTDLAGPLTAQPDPTTGLAVFQGLTLTGSGEVTLRVSEGVLTTLSSPILVTP